jgi:hypothetical protein
MDKNKIEKIQTLGINSNYLIDRLSKSLALAILNIEDYKENGKLKTPEQILSQIALNAFFQIDVNYENILKYMFGSEYSKSYKYYSDLLLTELLTLEQLESMLKLITDKLPYEKNQDKKISIPKSKY